MKRVLFAAVSTACLIALGCDKKDEMKAPTPESDKAADKMSTAGQKAMEGVKDSVKGGADEMKTGVDKMSTQAVNAETVQNNILDLIGKANQNIKEKKFDEAQKFVDQVKTLKGQLPADAQKNVDTSLAEVEKAIAAGKTMMMPAK